MGRSGEAGLEFGSALVDCKAVNLTFSPSTAAPLLSSRYMVSIACLLEFVRLRGLHFLPFLMWGHRITLL